MPGENHYCDGDDTTGEAWLRDRFTYVLYRRSPEPMGADQRH